VVKTPQVEWLSLINNRLDMIMNVPKNAFSFKLWSRFSDDANVCSPEVNVLSCHLSECFVRKVENGTLATETYVCPKKQCVACNATASEDWFLKCAFIRGIMNTLTAAPVEMRIGNSTDGVTLGSVKFVTGAGLTLLLGT
jgi:hypothetical protein